MNRQPVNLLLFMMLLWLAGCSKPKPAATLVVHVHGKVFDFLDHDDKIIFSTEEIDHFDEIFQDPKITRWIQGNRVVVRFEGGRTAEAITAAKPIHPVLLKIASAGIKKTTIVYTNE